MATKRKNPLFNSSVKTYLDVANIEVVHNVPNSRIYYTLDESTPTVSSTYILSGQNITVRTIGPNVIKCVAATKNSSGVYVINSDVVSFSYTIIQNTNYDVTNTTDDYVVKQSNELGPVNPKGAQLYVDLTQFLPDKLINQDGFMELVYMFQDYMNNGFRVIPKPYREVISSNKIQCGGIVENIQTEWVEPYDHDISMILDYENSSQSINVISQVEIYDRNRDISTFSIGDNELEEYKNKYSSKLTSGVFYNNYKYYKNMDELLKVLPIEETNYRVFLSSLDNSSINNSDIESQVELKSKIHQYLEYYEGQLIVNLYFCSYDDFLNNFTYSGEYTLQDTYYPTFDGISDNYNQDKVQTIRSFTNKLDLENYLVPDTKRFRISVLLDDISEILDLTNINSEMSVFLLINGYDNLTAIPTKCSLLAPRFKSIYEWQDPTIFYNHFSNQNEFRIDDKRSTILEKIHRIAYMKDVDVIDYEFIDFIVNQMGYSIEVEMEDVEGNEYYKTNNEKESALRDIIRNLPNFYKIKCTKNGLEALLLSFGIVGEVIYLYTIGNEKKQGYVDFINAKDIEGGDDDDIFNGKPQLSSSIASDWFPSPHFRVELDLLTQNLRLDTNKLGVGLINKAIKNTKPINTVFQGFYGKMVSNFGYMFIHKPKGLMKGYSLTSVVDECDSLDVWDSRCN